MTIDEKRLALKRFCGEQDDCRSCLLSNEYEDCSVADLWKISAENIERAYNLAFGGKKEEINHPDRYKSGKFECIDVMLDVFGADAVKHFCILNAFKYLWRAEKKNGVEDIKKAVWYLNKFIELSGGEKDNDR